LFASLTLSPRRAEIRSRLIAKEERVEYALTIACVPVVREINRDRPKATDRPVSDRGSETRAATARAYG